MTKLNSVIKLISKMDPFFYKYAIIFAHKKMTELKLQNVILLDEMIIENIIRCVTVNCPKKNYVDN